MLTDIQNENGGFNFLITTFGFDYFLVVKTNLVPLPTSDSTQISPSRNSTALLYYHQPDTGPVKFFLKVESLENDKNFIEIFRINSYSVVLYRKLPMVLELPGQDGNHTRVIRLGLFQCVTDQVLEYLQNGSFVGKWKNSAKGEIGSP